LGANIHSLTPATTGGIGDAHRRHGRQQVRVAGEAGGVRFQAEFLAQRLRQKRIAHHGLGHAAVVETGDDEMRRVLPQQLEPAEQLDGIGRLVVEMRALAEKIQREIPPLVFAHAGKLRRGAGDGCEHVAPGPGIVGQPAGGRLRQVERARSKQPRERRGGVGGKRPGRQERAQFPEEIEGTREEGAARLRPCRTSGQSHGRDARATRPDGQGWHGRPAHVLSQLATAGVCRLGRVTARGFERRREMPGVQFVERGEEMRRRKSTAKLGLQPGEHVGATRERRHRVECRLPGELRQRREQRMQRPAPARRALGIERRETGPQKTVVERGPHGGIGHADGQCADGLAVATRERDDPLSLGHGIGAKVDALLEVGPRERTARPDLSPRPAPLVEEERRVFVGRTGDQNFDRHGARMRGEHLHRERQRIRRGQHDDTGNARRQRRRGGEGAHLDFWAACAGRSGAAFGSARNGKPFRYGFQKLRCACREGDLRCLGVAQTARRKHRVESELEFGELCPARGLGKIAGLRRRQGRHIGEAQAGFGQRGLHVEHLAGEALRPGKVAGRRIDRKDLAKLREVDRPEHVDPGQQRFEPRRHARGRHP
jgi:hypothetical protein